MIAVEETIVVDAAHRLSGRVPESVPPGTHRAVILIREENSPVAEESARVIFEDGMPVLVAPAGAPAMTAELIKALRDDAA